MESSIIIKGVPLEQFMDAFSSLIEEKIHHAVKTIKKEQLQEKFLSPSEVCNLFKTKISRQTLANWSKGKGEIKLKKHVVGRSVYYRYSDVIHAIKEIKQFKSA